jgi:hypothetical protein
VVLTLETLNVMSLTEVTAALPWISEEAIAVASGKVTAAVNATSISVKFLMTAKQL